MGYQIFLSFCFNVLIIASNRKLMHNPSVDPVSITFKPYPDAHYFAPSAPTQLQATIIPSLPRLLHWTPDVCSPLLPYSQFLLKTCLRSCHSLKTL